MSLFAVGHVNYALSSKLPPRQSLKTYKKTGAKDDTLQSTGKCEIVAHELHITTIGLITA